MELRYDCHLEDVQPSGVYKRYLRSTALALNSPATFKAVDNLTVISDRLVRRQVQRKEDDLPSLHPGEGVLYSYPSTGTHAKRKTHTAADRFHQRTKVLIVCLLIVRLQQDGGSFLNSYLCSW